MQSITYPDGETVSYGYDAGGQVVSVSGTHYGQPFHYVNDIGYDEYGNGVRTEYSYDENRRWLDAIETQKDGVQYQNIAYSFDRVGNVLGYTSDCTGRGDYTTSQTYTYDSLYQLVKAEGHTVYDPYKGGVVPVHQGNRIIITFRIC